mmetsp:Transcript_49484/g.96797  ORF Transcript_49484/g.96797 Transcript_49484/m.96797 type:complete len:1170 (+) Transcript_49484:3-3512(+)
MSTYQESVWSKKDAHVENRDNEEYSMSTYQESIEDKEEVLTKDIYDGDYSTSTTDHTNGCPVVGLDLKSCCDDATYASYEMLIAAKANSLLSVSLNQIPTKFGNIDENISTAEEIKIPKDSQAEKVVSCGSCTLKDDCETLVKRIVSFSRTNNDESSLKNSHKQEKKVEIKTAELLANRFDAEYGSIQETDCGPDDFLEMLHDYGISFSLTSSSGKQKKKQNIMIPNEQEIRKRRINSKNVSPPMSLARRNEIRRNLIKKIAVDSFDAYSLDSDVETSSQFLETLRCMQRLSPKAEVLADLTSSPSLNSIEKEQNEKVNAKIPTLALQNIDGVKTTIPSGILKKSSFTTSLDVQPIMEGYNSLSKNNCEELERTPVPNDKVNVDKIGTKIQETEETFRNSLNLSLPPKSLEQKSFEAERTSCEGGVDLNKNNCTSTQMYIYPKSSIKNMRNNQISNDHTLSRNSKDTAKVEIKKENMTCPSLESENKYVDTRQTTKVQETGDTEKIDPTLVTRQDTQGYCSLENRISTDSVAKIDDLANDEDKSLVKHNLPLNFSHAAKGTQAYNFTDESIIPPENRKDIIGYSIELTNSEVLDEHESSNLRKLQKLEHSGILSQSTSKKHYVVQMKKKPSNKAHEPCPGKTETNCVEAMVEHQCVPNLKNMNKEAQKFVSIGPKESSEHSNNKEGCKAKHNTPLNLGQPTNIEQLKTSNSPVEIPATDSSICNLETSKEYSVTSDILCVKCMESEVVTGHDLPNLGNIYNSVHIEDLEDTVKIENECHIGNLENRQPVTDESENASNSRVGVGPMTDHHSSRKVNVEKLKEESVDSVELSEHSQSSDHMSLNVSTLQADAKNESWESAGKDMSTQQCPPTVSSSGVSAEEKGKIVSASQSEIIKSEISDVKAQKNIIDPNQSSIQKRQFVETWLSMDKQKESFLQDNIQCNNNVNTGSVSEYFPFKDLTNEGKIELDDKQNITSRKGDDDCFVKNVKTEVNPGQKTDTFDNTQFAKDTRIKIDSGQHNNEGKIIEKDVVPEPIATKTTNRVTFGNLVIDNSKTGLTSEFKTVKRIKIDGNHGHFGNILELETSSDFSSSTSDGPSFKDRGFSHCSDYSSITNDTAFYSVGLYGELEKFFDYIDGVACKSGGFFTSARHDDDKHVDLRLFDGTFMKHGN